MVYIVFGNTSLRRFHSDDYMPEDYWIEVAENGTAQVTKDVAEQLVESDLDVTYKEDS